MSELYVIPSTQETTFKKLRVAAYVRVSTDDYDQENSFLNQYDYYSGYIKANPEWEFVDMYADEGITGTELKHRDEFNRMFEDCKDGKIDLIIVKSISRFARNTYDCLKYTRAIKQYGADVKFEKEGIDTREMTNETELAVLSSMAQEESISLSNNVKIGVRHRMMDGTFCYSRVPYGYRKIGRQLVIEESEAKIVRLIYNAYISGKVGTEIANELNKAGVPKPGKLSSWTSGSVKNILKNSTYTGDVILQKTYAEGFPAKRKNNHGELTQYLVKDYCPAIISKETFECSQKKRKLKHPGTKKCTEKEKNELNGIIQCQRCSTKLERRYNDKWLCPTHSKTNIDNRIEPIPEKKIKSGFVECYDKLYCNIENVLIPMINHIQEFKNFQNRTDEKIEEIKNRIAQITEQILIIGKLKAEGCMVSAIYMQKNRELNAELTRLKKDKKNLLGNNECEALLKQTTKIIRVLEATGAIAEFDENIFKAIVNRIWIADNTSCIYELVNGVNIKIDISEV